MNDPDYERWWRERFPTLTRHLRMMERVNSDDPMRAELVDLKEGFRWARRANDWVESIFLAGRNHHREYPDDSDAVALDKLRALLAAGWDPS